MTYLTVAFLTGLAFFIYLLVDASHLSLFDAVGLAVLSIVLGIGWIFSLPMWLFLYVGKKIISRSCR